VADINDRLDRLQRREEFDRFGRPLRPVPAETPVGPVVGRPAGVDDRLGEVLDAVASVVSRHPGLSVMVALADGRAGRPVIRVTERDGSVETGVVVVGSRAVDPLPETAPAATGPTVIEHVAAGPGWEPARDPGWEPPARPAPAAPTPAAPAPAAPTPAEYGPYDGLSTRAAAPTRSSVPGSDPVFEPAYRDSLPSRDAVRAAAPANGRHAAARDDEATGRSGSSWHDALWSPESRGRFRPAEPERGEAGPAAPGPTIPLPEDTSQVVSRLAQLLRDNPTLASTWSREAQE
jgi:hypothetical protein